MTESTESSARETHPDIYWLAYAIGVYDSGTSRNEYRLTPNCKVRCCEQPALALGLHLRHVAAAMGRDPLASEILARVNPEGLPKRADDYQQGAFWLGYYHGRARLHHDDRMVWTEAIAKLED